MDTALASLRFFFYVSLLQDAAALGNLLVNSLLPQNADKIIHFCELLSMKHHMHMICEKLLFGMSNTHLMEI